MKEAGDESGRRVLLMAVVLAVCLPTGSSGQQGYFSIQGARTDAGWGGGLGLTCIDDRTLISAQSIRAISRIDLFASKNPHTTLSMIQYGRRVISFEGGFMAIMAGPGFMHELRQERVNGTTNIFAEREQVTTNSLGIGVEFRAVTLEGPLGGTVALFGFLSRSEPFLGIQLGVMLGGEIKTRRGNLSTGR